MKYKADMHFSHIDFWILLKPYKYVSLQANTVLTDYYCKKA